MCYKESTSVIPLPDQLDFPQATALLVQGLTAYFLLQLSAPPQPGQSILIHAAAGGVGSLAIQLAKLLGAGNVIATASSSEKLDLARRLGADFTINYMEAGWVAQVLQATHGKGADIILESVGGQIGEQSLQALAPQGHIVVFGALDVQSTSLNNQQVTQLVYGNQSLIGFALPSLLTQHPELAGKALRELFEYAVSGKLHVIIGKTFPLADAHSAHRAIEDRQTTGKVVLVP